MRTYRAEACKRRVDGAGMGDENTTMANGHLWSANNRIGELHVERVYADEEGLAPRLAISLTARVWRNPGTAPISLGPLRGEVRHEGGPRPTRIGTCYERCADGDGGPTILTPVDHPSQSRSLTLVIDLDDARLAQLDHRRGAGALALKLMLRTVGWWHISLPRPKPRTPPLVATGSADQPEVEVVGGLLAVQGEVQAEVEASRWADILQQVGYGSYRLIAVPATPSERGGLLIEALRRTDEAQQLILAAKMSTDYSRAVGACRDALEQIAKAFGSEKLDKSGRLAVLKDVRDADVRDRLDAALDAIRTLTHLGHHDADTAVPAPPREFTRGQAEFVLHTTLAAIGLAARG